MWGRSASSSYDGVSRRQRANGTLDRLRSPALAAARLQSNQAQSNQAHSNPSGWWGMRSGSSGPGLDEYRTETLRRLEEEQREFKAFLDRLRHAKDKAEFDEFMAERRNRPQAPSPQPEN